MTFSTLGVSEPLIRAISELGFVNPTEVQQKAIPEFLKREKDVIALAQTGTGKTAAFGLPVLQHIDTKSKQVQALILSPTRELCLQITQDLTNYSKHLTGLQLVAVYGGSSIVQQIRQLRQGAQVVIATPGRLIDLLDRGALKLDRVETLVLDEADEMLNMGFQEDIENILSQTPEQKLTGLFSATMPSAIRQIANQYLREVTEVSIGRKNTASAAISHQYAVVHAKDKLAALRRIIDFNNDFFGIVFCTTRIETQEISDTLVKAGYAADCLHGDLSQPQRDKVMQRFRRRALRILCATDVAARGIDVQDITHVIHYHLPDDIENYTHRSGRTARAGKEGISIALLHVREAYKLHQIERMAGVKFEKFLIPKGDEIIAQRIRQFVQGFLDSSPELPTPLKNEWIYPLMQLSQETLVEKILAFELQQLDKDYIQHADLNVDESAKRKDQRTSSSTSGSRGGAQGTSRLWINLGKKDGLRYDDIREMIFKHTKVSGHHVRDIQMQGVQSIFEIDNVQAERILKSFKQVIHKGRAIRIWSDEKRPSGGGKPAREHTRTPRSESRMSEKSSSRPGQRPRYKARPADDTSW